MNLISLDLWILLKIRMFTRLFVKLFGSLIQVVSIMAMGAAILLVYSWAHVQIKIPIYTEEYAYARIKEAKSEVLSIDRSRDSSFLQREIAILKNQALSLEMSLKKMKTQYKDLSNIAYSHHKDEMLADFASEVAGGSIVDTPDTESYYEPHHEQVTFFGIPIWKASYFTPRKVIQPWTQAGECWAFKGSSGKIVIRLAHPTFIDKVTLEHIPVSASLTGSINSAPQHFAIYGFVERSLLALDSFTYDVNGSFSQTFKLKNKEVQLYAIQTILLRINSNWGHPDYTCIYRFKVHGKIATLANSDEDYIGEEREAHTKKCVKSCKDDKK